MADNNQEKTGLSRKKALLISGGILVLAISIVGFLFWQSANLNQKEQNPNDIIATVGNENITFSEFNRFLADANLDNSEQGNEQATQQLKDDVLRYLIESKLLRQKSIELGIGVSEEEIQSKMIELRLVESEEGRYNAETQALREKIYDIIISKRSGQYITVRFDIYFGDDTSLSEEELTNIRENRDQINKEQIDYANSFTKGLYADIVSSKISFDEAMKIVEEDEKLSSGYWELRGTPLTGEFVMDGLGRQGQFQKAFDYEPPNIIEPYLHSELYLKDPSAEFIENPDSGQEIPEVEKKEGMWIILNVVESTNGETNSIDEWLDSQYAKKLSIQDDSFMSSSFFYTPAYASGHPEGSGDNNAASCGNIYKVKGYSPHNFASAGARIMYFTTSGAGPYNLSATLTHRTSSSAITYNGGKCNKGTYSAKAVCHDIRNPNNYVGSNQGWWCCGDSHNQHVVTASVPAGYELIGYSIYKIKGTNSGDPTTYFNKSGDLSGSSGSFSYTLTNGYTNYINVYAKEAGQKYYFCKTKVDYTCEQTNGVYGTKAACEAAVQQYRSGQTDDYRCYETSSQCSANCIAPPNILTVKSRVDGGVLDGVSITRVSGTSGTAGTTTYTFTRTSDINTTLRAPLFHNGAQFDRWTGGCNPANNRDCTVSLSSGDTITITANYISCTIQYRLECFQGDSYWYNSCNQRGERNEQCGVDSYSAWANFCNDGDVWRKRTFSDRGCSTGVCFTNTSETREFVENCDPYGCSAGACLPPIVEVGLSVNPNSGTEPLDVDLIAVVGGTAIGPITYSFWWHCTNGTTSVTEAESTCGSLPSPSSGICTTNGFGAKCNAVNSTTQTVSWSFLEGIHIPKVIAQRDTAVPATAESTITVKALFIPDKLPNPFVRNDPGLAFYDTATAAVVVATPLYIVMLFVAGFHFLTAGANPTNINTSKKIALFSTVGYVTIVVLWMTTAAISGVIF